MAEDPEEHKPLSDKARDLGNEWLTSVFGELSPQDLRELLRGDPASRPNRRYGIHDVSFWFHMKPRWYPKSVTRVTYTFALGWLSTLLFVVLGVSGSILMFYYTPSTRQAYSDVLNIVGNVFLGKTLRDMHRLGAELMVGVVMLHMARVFFTASYKQPRSFNWTVGVALLLVTWLFSYSGYLLPWDQLAYWAVTIGVSMANAIPVIGDKISLLLLGAPAVGQPGLLRFYALHVIILPLASILLFGIHYFKVVRQGISKPPSADVRDDAYKERVPFLPEVWSREALWLILSLLAMLVAVWTFFTAPLEMHADPQVTPLHSTAPWYFLWIQGLAKLPDIFGDIVEGKFVYGILIPGIVIGALFALPYLDRGPSRRWQDRKGMVAVGIAFIIVWGLLTYMGTPSYMARASAAEEIALAFVPYDRDGRINKVPWDQLLEGEYSTEGLSKKSTATQQGQEAAPEKLAEFLAELSAAMEDEQDALPEGVATVGIKIWQQDLKRVDIRITWQEDGEQAFFQHTYIHRATAPH